MNVPEDPKSICFRRWVVNRNVSSAIVSSLLLLCAFGCSSEGAAEKLLERANTAVEAGQLETAIELFEEVESRYPTTTAARRARDAVDFYRDLARVEAVYPHRQTRDMMIRVGRALLLYRDRRGRWPDSLERLVPGDFAQVPVDAWGWPLDYQVDKRGRRYRLVSLGADNAPGGAGDAGDLILENGSFRGGS